MRVRGSEVASSLWVWTVDYLRADCELCLAGWDGADECSVRLGSTSSIISLPAITESFYTACMRVRPSVVQGVVQTIRQYSAELHSVTNAALGHRWSITRRCYGCQSQSLYDMAQTLHCMRMYLCAVWLFVSHMSLRCDSDLNGQPTTTVRARCSARSTGGEPGRRWLVWWCATLLRVGGHVDSVASMYSGEFQKSECVVSCMVGRSLNCWSWRQYGTAAPLHHPPPHSTTLHHTPPTLHPHSTLTLHTTHPPPSAAITASSFERHSPIESFVSHILLLPSHLSISFQPAACSSFPLSSPSQRHVHHYQQFTAHRRLLRSWLGRHLPVRP